MSTSDGIAARVRRGAELLDRKEPGWWREITLRTLDMSDCRCCVLGQTFGHFHGGMKHLFPGGRDDMVRAQTYGFDVGNGLDYWTDDRGYDALTGAWRAEVARRAEAAPSRARAT